MSLTLTLVRHAKSSWDHVGLQDFDRPLNERGLRNAPEMGKRLAKRGDTPDVIISSPAKRAMTTAEMIADEIGFDKNNILREPAIYAAGLSTLVDIVTGIDDGYQSAMLVGHNPGFTELCNYLCAVRIDNVPTCGIVQIKFRTNAWHTIAKHDGEMIDFDYPKKAP